MLKRLEICPDFATLQEIVEEHESFCAGCDDEFCVATVHQRDIDINHVLTNQEFADQLHPIVQDLYKFMKSHYDRPNGEVQSLRLMSTQDLMALQAILGCRYGHLEAWDGNARFAVLSGTELPRLHQVGTIQTQFGEAE